MEQTQDQLSKSNLVEIKTQKTIPFMSSSKSKTPIIQQRKTTVQQDTENVEFTQESKRVFNELQAVEDSGLNLITGSNYEPNYSNRSWTKLKIAAMNTDL